MSAKPPITEGIFAYVPAFGDFPHFNDYMCESCIDFHKVDLGPDDVQCWDVGSSGWTEPVTCACCLRPIDVEVDG